MKQKISFFIGAGFSINLGGYTTADLANFMDIILKDNASLKERLEEANSKVFRNTLMKNQIKELMDSLLILLDGDDAKSLKDALEKQEKAINKLVENYRKFFPKGNYVQFKYYLKNLYKEFDLLAFKSFYLKWKKLNQDHNTVSNFVRFLTILTKALEENISIPTQEIFSKDAQKYSDIEYIYYLREDRIKKALRFVKYIAYKLFKLKLSIRRREYQIKSKLYKKFFLEIFKDYYRIPDDYNIIVKEDFFEIPIFFITTNWDPFLAYLLIITNNTLNRIVKQRSGFEEKILKFYVDFNIPTLITRLDFQAKQKNPISKGGFLITSDGAFAVNSQAKKGYSNIIIRLQKFYAIHGIFNLRVCPYCGNAFFIIPLDIRKVNFERYEGLKDIFLLDPIPNLHDFNIVKTKYINKIIYYSFLKGRPDELLCPYCGNPTYFEDTPLTIQTIFKNKEDFYLHKIKMNAFHKLFSADHIIIIGYSFPEDDIVNNFLLELMFSSKNYNKANRKITIISYHPKYQDKVWYKINEIKPSEVEDSINIKAVERIFGKLKGNIRVSFLGFPEILNKVSAREIINW